MLPPARRRGASRVRAEAKERRAASAVRFILFCCITPQDDILISKEPAAAPPRDISAPIRAQPRRRRAYVERPRKHDTYYIIIADITLPC